MTTFEQLHDVTAALFQENTASSKKNQKVLGNLVEAYHLSADTVTNSRGTTLGYKIEELNALVPQALLDRCYPGAHAAAYELWKDLFCFHLFQALGKAPRHEDITEEVICRVIGRTRRTY